MSATPRLVGPVAVIVPRFPSVTGAALLREIDALEREGVPVMLVAVERDEPSLVPEEVEGWIERVLYLRLISRRVLAENLSVLVRHPRRWLGTLARLAWDARADLSRVAGVLGLYLGAVELGSRLRASGVRHVHAHDAELPALVARIASRVHRSNALPFSVTVHGHDIAASHAGLATRLEGVSFVRCTSYHAASSLRGALGAAMPDAPIVMIRRGIAASPSPVLPSRVPALGRPGIERALRVLCVARLEPQKGLAHLFEALRLLTEAAGGLRRLDRKSVV